MKPSIRNTSNRFALTGLACAVLVWIVGCAVFAQHSDPLAGWKLDSDPYSGDQAIEKDYHDYIQQLPTEERKYAGPVSRFEDGTGQHAVLITIAQNGTDWAHVLFYDKKDKRIKVMKYVMGHYRS